MNNCTVFSLRGNGTFNIFKKSNETRNEQQQEELKNRYEKEKEQLYDSGSIELPKMKRKKYVIERKDLIN